MNTAPNIVVLSNSELASDVNEITNMVDTLDTLWEEVRKNIAASCEARGSNDPADGCFGPVGGIDWVMVQLVGAVYDMKRTIAAANKA